jgi:DNA-binding NtrC family response regulator
MKVCLSCCEKIHLEAIKCRYCLEFVEKIEGDDIDAAVDENDVWDLKEIRAVAERAIIEKAIKYRDGNISQVANILNVTRPTLYSLIGKYSIAVKR